MGMVVGPPPCFDLTRIHDATARAPYTEQITSYFYRALLSTAFVARVTLPDDQNAACYSAVCIFEREHGHLVFSA